MKSFDDLKVGNIALLAGIVSTLSGAGVLLETGSPALAALVTVGVALPINLVYRRLVKIDLR